MKLSLLITDNITELLVKIIKFTKTRRKILMQNVNNLHNPDFVPKDLPIDEFSESLNHAITEHTLNQRLLLCDSENIKFGPEGKFRVEAVDDKDAQDILAKNTDEYLEIQINKILENSLNQRVATELLRQKESVI